MTLKEFKLHLHLKGSTQLTLLFNSPSRRFYLSVIALVVNEMKKLGKIKSIPLQEHLDLLSLLNESIGDAAGSSDKENLLPRIYRKWKNALPNWKKPLFLKSLERRRKRRMRQSERFIPLPMWKRMGGRVSLITWEARKNVRLKFAIDKIGVDLNEISMIFGDFSKR